MRGLSAFVLVMAMAMASLARAETKDPDPDLVCSLDIAPTHEEHVPANAPALVALLDRADPDPKLHPDLYIGALRSESGAFIALKQTREAGTDALLLRPERALEPGAYELAIEKRCPNATKPFDKGPQAISVKLAVDPASPLPTTIGTARAIGPNENGDAEVEVTLSAELAAFHSVARIDLELNRKPLDMPVRYDSIPFEKGVARYHVSNAACPMEQMDGEVHPIHVFLKAHVAGATEDPEPLGIDANVRCDRHAPLPEPGSQPFPQPNAANVDGACGCRAAGAPGQPSLWLYIAGIACGLVLLRRRRHFPTR